MKLLVTLLGLQLACLTVVPGSAAAANGFTPAEREAIAVATEAVHTQLKLKPGTLRLVPEHFKHSGEWVFLTSHLRRPDGSRYDYAGTDLHDAAQAGAMSDLCAALLRREGTAEAPRWRVVDMAVGPTDLAWEGWSATHKAPAALFQ